MLAWSRDEGTRTGQCGIRKKRGRACLVRTVCLVRRTTPIVLALLVGWVAGGCCGTMPLRVVVVPLESGFCTVVSKLLLVE